MTSDVKPLYSIALHFCDMIVAFNEIDKSKVKDELLAVDGDDIKREADKLRKVISSEEATPYNTLLLGVSLRLCDMVDEYVKIDQSNTRQAFLGVGKGELELASHQLRAVVNTTQNIIYA